MGKSPGEGHDNPLQYSCLENPIHRGAWWAIIHAGHKESDTTEWLFDMKFPTEVHEGWDWLVRQVQNTILCLGLQSMGSQRLSTHTYTHIKTNIAMRPVLWFGEGFNWYTLSTAHLLTVLSWNWEISFPLDYNESESHSAVSHALQPHGLHSSWHSPGQNTGVGSLSLL